jgi:hypothetical protein
MFPLLRRILFLDSILMIRHRRTKRELDAPAASTRGVRRAKVKEHSQRSVIIWVTKIYYLELLHAFEGTLSRWSQLHLQSLAPTPFPRKVDVGQVIKIMAES